MKTPTTPPKILIIGGGFAGVAAAAALRKSRVRATITLVSDKDYLTYYPSLYSLVTDGKQRDVALPLSALFKRGKVQTVKGTFVGLDQVRQVATIAQSDISATLSYDYAVVALGSEANYFNIPGLKEKSHSFKSVDEALKLKAHFETVLAKAAMLPKDEVVAALHTLVIGGGPSGVELAATLKRYLTMRARAHRVDPSMVTIDIIEAAPRLLPTMSEKASAIAERRLRTMGVNIFTNRALRSEEGGEVILNDMEVKTGTVIWTAGTAIHTAYGALLDASLSERKRVVVTDWLTLPNDNHVFIAGDGAATAFSGLAQTAIHNGTYIGKSIARLIKGDDVQPYTPKRPTFVIPIGAWWAIYSYKNILVCGLLPSLLRRIIDWRYRLSVTL